VTRDEETLAAAAPLYVSCILIVGADDDWMVSYRSLFEDHSYI